MNIRPIFYGTYIFLIICIICIFVNAKKIEQNLLAQSLVSLIHESISIDNLKISRKNSIIYKGIIIILKYFLIVFNIYL